LAPRIVTTVFGEPTGITPGHTLVTVGIRGFTVKLTVTVCVVDVPLLVVTTVILPL
jgi:hypothetical protein